MEKKRMNAEEREDLLLYLESVLRCVKALHASVGEVMADVAVLRDTILEDEQGLAMNGGGIRSTKESAKMVNGGMYPDASYTEMAMEIASTQEYKN